MGGYRIGIRVLCVHRNSTVFWFRLRCERWFAQFLAKARRHRFFRRPQSCESDRRHPPVWRGENYLSALRPGISRTRARTICVLIVTESVFSMEGDIAPINALLELARKYGAELVIDEAHATGVCGPQGRGIVADLGVEREMLAIVHTCGKALASAGAFVCGGGALKDYLINRARIFVFSTAMPLYLAGQIHAALALARAAESERAHLHHIAFALREELAAAGLNFGASVTHIVPVIVGSNEIALHLARGLRRSGFAVKAIRPPTVPPGTARLRVSLTSKITLDDTHRLAAAARKFLLQSTFATVAHV